MRAIFAKTFPIAPPLSSREMTDVAAQPPRSATGDASHPFPRTLLLVLGSCAPDVKGHGPGVLRTPGSAVDAVLHRDVGAAVVLRGAHLSRDLHGHAGHQGRARHVRRR